MSGYLFNVAFRGRGSISNDCRDIYLTATPVMCPERVSSYTISSALLMSCRDSKEIFSFLLWSFELSFWRVKAYM